jgi:PAS domain S-box-containing protein
MRRAGESDTGPAGVSGSAAGRLSDARNASQAGIEQTPPLFWRWLGRLGYYGLALLLVATGEIMRAGLVRLVGPGLPTYITFYPLVMVAALVGGWGPGLLATLATAVVAGYWLLPPTGLFKVESTVDLVGLVFFSAMGAFMSIVAQLYRRMRDHLEDLVILRTTALSRANEQLQERGDQLQTQSEELAESAQSLERERQVLQSVMDGARNSHLVYLDRDFNFVRVNEAYARTCGYTPQEMIGKNHFALYPHAENEAIFARVRDTGVPVQFRDKPFVFPDQPERGTTYWDWTLTPVKNGSGEVEGLVFSLFETTQRKRAEEALRESEERYRQLFQEDLTADFLCTPDGRVLLCNAAFGAVFGFSSADEAVGTSMLQLYIDPAERDSLLETLKRQGRLDRYEGWRKRRDGTPIYVVENLVGHFNDQGELYEIQGYIFDDTERKRAEEGLRELNATLESKVFQRTAELQDRARQLRELSLEVTEAESRERKRLAEILHDDLQQTLAAAKFHLGMVSSQCGNDEALQRTAEQVRQLLVDAIGKSRSLSHELSPPGPAHSDLRETFEWLASQMQTKHGLTVRVDVGDQIVVRSEPLKALLFKAAQEMLFNVIKHARVQEARLELRRRRQNLYLVVSDKGRGFDPRGPDSSAGSGLLSIRERVDLLGGRMKVRSARGKGTTFRIVVPNTAR